MREPNFIDLLLNLWDDRRLMTTCLAFCMVMGGVVAVLWPPIYAYTTTIEIGTLQHRETSSAIEHPDAVVVKITNAFLPAVERAHGQMTATPGFTLSLEVKNPRNTGLLILTSKGTEAREDEHIALQRLVAVRVVEEHRRAVDLMRTNLRIELDEVLRSVSSVKGKALTLTMQRNLVQEKKLLTAQRLQEIDDELVRISSNRDQAGRSLTSQEQVLTLMMLDLQMTRERDRRDALQRELVLGLAEENDKLSRAEADLQRDKQYYEGQVAAIEARIANLSETRIVDGPQRSQRRVGIGPVVIMAMAVILGVVIGIALLLLRQALRDRARSQGPASPA